MDNLYVIHSGLITNTTAFTVITDIDIDWDTRKIKIIGIPEHIARWDVPNSIAYLLLELGDFLSHDGKQYRTESDFQSLRKLIKQERIEKLLDTL